MFFTIWETKQAAYFVNCVLFNMGIDLSWNFFYCVLYSIVNLELQTHFKVRNNCFQPKLVIQYSGTVAGRLSDTFPQSKPFVEIKKHRIPFSLPVWGLRRLKPVFSVLHYLTTVPAPFTVLVVGNVFHKTSGSFISSAKRLILCNFPHDVSIIFGTRFPVCRFNSYRRAKRRKVAN